MCVVMGEWFGLEWIKTVWVPAFIAGSAWLATVWKNGSQDRSSRDVRLDSRLDKELARTDAEAEDLRHQVAAAEERRRQCEREKDAVWFAARRMEGIAHKYRHDAANAIMVMAARAQIPPTDMLPEVPSLHSLLPKSE